FFLAVRLSSLITGSFAKDLSESTRNLLVISSAVIVASIFEPDAPSLYLSAKKFATSLGSTNSFRLPCLVQKSAKRFHSSWYVLRVPLADAEGSLYLDPII